MPQVVLQHISGPSLEAGFNGESSDATYIYKVYYEEDPNIVMQAVVDFSEETVPLLGKILKRKRVNLTPESNDVWIAEVPYSSATTPNGQQEQPQTGDVSLPTFDFGVETAKVTHSVKTVKRYAPPGKTATDHKGAIGVSNGHVEGCDVLAPTANIALSIYPPTDTVTKDWIRQLNALSGKVNEKACMGFEPGELLFLGATGAPRPGGEDYEFQLKMSFKEKEKNFKIGDIDVDEKEGHHYVWTEYGPEIDLLANTTATVAVAAHVEQVFYTADFSFLGLDGGDV